MAKNRQINAPPLPSLCPRPCVLCRDVPILVVGFFLVKDQGTKCEHKQWKNESREASRSSERGQQPRHGRSAAAAKGKGGGDRAIKPQRNFNDTAAHFSQG
jgi:hypothetical protein